MYHCLHTARSPEDSFIFSSAVALSFALINAFNQHKVISLIHPIPRYSLSPKSPEGLTTPKNWVFPEHEKELTTHFSFMQGKFRLGEIRNKNDCKQVSPPALSGSMCLMSSYTWTYFHSQWNPEWQTCLHCPLWHSQEFVFVKLESCTPHSFSQPVFSSFCSLIYCPWISPSSSLS